MLNWHLSMTNFKVRVREWFLDNFLAQSMTMLKLYSQLIHPPPLGKTQPGATFHYELFCSFPQNPHQCCQMGRLFMTWVQKGHLLVAFSTESRISVSRNTTIVN